MGQSSVVGVAFTVLILAAGIASIFSLNISSTNLINHVVPSAANQLNIIKSEFFDIEEMMLINDTIIFNITNIGSTSIKYDEFEKIDFFLVYSHDDTDYTKEIPMENPQENLTRWSARTVYVNQQEGDILNPINFTQGYGFWDPLETVEFEIIFYENYTEISYLKFCSPNGLVDYGLMGKKSNYGEHIILNGQNEGLVNHQLVTVPRNIQITPTVNLMGNSYWVSNITDTSFTINLDHSELFNCSFYWWAIS